MHRREMLRILPLSVIGMAAGMKAAFPADAAPLGLRYLEHVRDLLERIRSNQSDELLEAAHRIARTRLDGGSCRFEWDMGHQTGYDVWPGRPGLPDILTYGIPATAGKGDLILTDCYTDRIPALHDNGAFLISGPRPWGGDCIDSELLKPAMQRMKLKPHADLWIENYSTAYGAIMALPGETAPIGPASGVVGMTTFWMMVADAARLMAGAGAPIQVSGDELPLRDAEYADLNRPLGQEYFARIMEQHHAISEEYDTVRRIADMAVHSALNGGRVYVYSRYSSNLCAEATVRRGGLGLTFGVSGEPGSLVLMDDPLQRGRADLTFRPTELDTVIMGIGLPDDPVDLANFDDIRESGCGIAVIGPRMRNGRQPQGRSISGEADLYMGAMMDTYGLFALPGVQRKVCPTSGLITNQIFWAVCCQIADSIVARTGEAPGVYLSGALKGGSEKLNEVKRVYRERGY